MRAHTNITRKERNTLVLSDFKGADFSSSPLSVQSNRATKMRNLINEYGVNKKRHGWAQAWTQVIPAFDGAINGIYDWYDKPYQSTPFSTTQAHHIIIHAGHKIYRFYTYNDGTPSILNPAQYESVIWEGEYDDKQHIYPANTKSQAFYMDGKLYIVGVGTILVYDGKSITEIDADPYVPTTTISINNEDEAGTRASLDAVNMLTPKRINSLIGAEDEGHSWILDASIDSLEMIELSVTEGEGDNKVYVLYEILAHGSALMYNKRYVMTDGEYVEDESFIKNNEVVGAWSNNSLDGYGKISLSVNTKPVIEGEDNIKVYFSHKTEGYADRIKKCKFGCLFGADGNNDRLFLSGNIDYPNVEFYSEANDFTYFPDQNTVTLGSGMPITGMVRLSDGAMAVLKKPNTQEATIYYATGTYDTTYSDNSQVTKMTAIFPHAAGGIGEGLVSNRACANFLGDPMFVSPNGVQGIVMSQNLSTTERYTRERSRLIDEVLKGSAVRDMIAYQNKLYIAVHDDECYIADARYKFVPKDDIDGSYNYEWWHWDHMPVNVWGVVCDELCFGTTDGQVCFFTDDYKDSVRTDYDYNEMTVSNGGFVHSYKIQLQENAIVEFNANRPAHALIATDVTAVNGVCTMHDGEQEWIEDGAIVLLGNSTIKYEVSGVDYGEMTYRLSSNGVVQNINVSGQDLYLEIPRAYVARDNDAHTWLKLTKNGKELVIKKHPLISAPTSFHGKIETNVVAEWYTPVFDLGTNMWSKTLEQMSVSTEGTPSGAIQIGYVTRQLEKTFNAKGVNTLALDELDFADFAFDSGFANSYTKRINARNFNYIMFRFLSDNDKNCAVNEMTIQYKINKQNKGVR